MSLYRYKRRQVYVILSSFPFQDSKPDSSTYPAGGGILPGAGSIMAPLTYASKRKPVVTGKPSTTMLDCVRAK